MLKMGTLVSDKAPCKCDDQITLVVPVNSVLHDCINHVNIPNIFTEQSFVENYQAPGSGAQVGSSTSSFHFSFASFSPASCAHSRRVLMVIAVIFFASYTHAPTLSVTRFKSLTSRKETERDITALRGVGWYMNHFPQFKLVILQIQDRLLGEYFLGAHNSLTLVWSMLHSCCRFQLVGVYSIT